MIKKRAKIVLTVRKVRITDILKLFTVSSILYECGKDMAHKYDLHHWDNPRLKTFVIAGIGALKNTVYLVYDRDKPVATFQTRNRRNTLFFEKLATLPSEAGKGIGSFCLENIEEQAKRTGCSVCAMEVYEPSKHAISFYENRGYVITGNKGTLKYREVTMEKDL